MNTSTKEFIGKVKLRNQHCIYRDAECFFVEQTMANGTKRPEVTFIPSCNIDHLYEFFHGKKITPQIAANYISSLAQQWGWPYTYGYKLSFYIQEILVVLVATGRATVLPNGKGFEYQVM